MLASLNTFQILVYGALGLTVLGVLILLAMLWRDWRSGTLW